MVEHNVDMIRASDWIVDFGPGGGPEGGRVVGQGRPDQVADFDTPTGRVLGGRQASSPSFDAAAIRPLSMLERDDVEASPGSARQWLKRLIGDDVSAEALDPVDFDSLAVAFDDTEAAVRPYEIGGLDIEIARLLLEQTSDSSDEMKRLGQIWTDTPKAHLPSPSLVGGTPSLGSTDSGFSDTDRTKSPFSYRIGLPTLTHRTLRA